ncbi:MAG: oligosaccharide flippase family protein [Spirochaetia bacterium]|nr:oligosaccharide flippase family protein [Spirochaetia bacterium]
MISKLKPKSEFAKNVISLASGSAIGSAIIFLTVPVIARLYLPEDYGKFQIFASIIIIFSVISSFKFELALVLPKDRAESNAVLTLSLFFLIFTTVIFGIILYLTGASILRIMNAEVLQPYLLTILFGIFCAGFIQIGQYLFVRENAFKKAGANRIFQSSISQGMKIGIGLMWPSFLGLYISQLTGYLVAGYLAFARCKFDVVLSIQKLTKVFYKYKKFMYFTTPSVFMNILSLNLPVFLLGKYHGPEAIAYYVMAVKLIDAPMGLIGGAIGQVYFKNAADTFHKGPNDFFTLYKNTVKKLALLFIGPTIFVFLFSKILVPTVLGEKWVLAISVIEIVVFWKFFDFIYSSVSTSLATLERQGFEYVYRAIFLVARFLSLYLFQNNFHNSIIAYSIVSILYNLTYIITVYIIIKLDIHRKEYNLKLFKNKRKYVAK